MQCTLIVKLFFKYLDFETKKISNNLWKRGKKNGKEMKVSQFTII
jgi:hypothetical protein